MIYIALCTQSKLIKTLHHDGASVSIYENTCSDEYKSFFDGFCFLFISWVRALRFVPDDLLKFPFAPAAVSLANVVIVSVAPVSPFLVIF